MRISPQNVREDETFRNFIEEKELRESTEILYARRLTDFCNFIDKNPTELMEEALEEHSQELRNEKVSNYVEDYLDELKDKGKSINTIKNRFDTLKSFFNDFNIDKSVIKNIKDFSNENLTFDEIPTREHVRKAVNVSGLRDKAIILLHFTSGMGAIELRYLTYRDFIDSVDEYLDLNDEEKLNIPKVVSELDKREDIIGTWQIKKIKNEIPYTAFNSPESTQAILDYLMDRERGNKSIKTFDAPLFVNTWNKPLEKSVHGAIFKRINDKAGFGHLDGKRRFLTSGTLRNTFEKTLYKAGLDKLAIDCMLGYKINNMNEFDNINDHKALKNQYINALDTLKLENTTVEEPNSEYDQLLAKFNENDEELKQIKEHVKYLEEIVKSMVPDKKKS